jgi:hypothetical protein
VVLRTAWWPEHSAHQGSGQVLVDQADGHRAFADGGGNPFGGSSADVSGGKDTRLAGLQEPAAGVSGIRTTQGQLEVDSRADESLLVEVQSTGQPIDIGLGPNEDE